MGEPSEINFLLVGNIIKAQLATHHSSEVHLIQNSLRSESQKIAVLCNYEVDYALSAQICELCVRLVGSNYVRNSLFLQL